MAEQDRSYEVEPGIEEEGFFDFIRPFKQSALRKLRESGYTGPISEAAIDVAVPEGPEGLLGKLRGLGRTAKRGQQVIGEIKKKKKLSGGKEIEEFDYETPRTIDYSTFPQPEAKEPKWKKIKPGPDIDYSKLPRAQGPGESGYTLEYEKSGWSPTAKPILRKKKPAGD